MIKLWDRTSRTVIATFAGHQGNVTHLSFSPNNRELVSLAWVPYEQTVRAEVIRWDISTRKRLNSFFLPPVIPLLQTKADSNPNSLVVFSCDCSIIATIGTDARSVEFWNIDNGQMCGTTSDVADTNGSIVALAISPDNHYLAMATGESWLNNDQIYHARVRLILWDIKNNRKIKSWTIVDNVRNVFADTVFSLAFSPQSQSLVVGGSHGNVDIWSIPTARKMLSLPRQPVPGAVTTLLFSPGGKTLAVGTTRGTGSLTFFHASSQGP